MVSKKSFVALFLVLTLLISTLLPVYATAGENIEPTGDSAMYEIAMESTEEDTKSEFAGAY